MRSLAITTKNERVLIVSNRENNTFIVRDKKGYYSIITNEDILTILR
jgi:hypothetical protein